MKHTRMIGGREVTLECSDRFEPAAQNVLETLEKLDARGPALHDGSRVQFGWSVLTLMTDGDGLRVHEPDFDGDPLGEVRPNLDTSLDVLVQQVKVLSGSGLPGEDVSFSDAVFIQGRALEAPNVFLTRQGPASDGDSGWYVGNLDDMDNAGGAKPEAVRVYELLGRRPCLLKVLTLPPSYAVTVQGDTITGVMDAEGHNYYDETTPTDR